ncbi:MAG: dienelactone hydrolase family protein [Planctomycetaceae bacterium]|nr:dienelactone hydrolase family protein [Planctomycetaceae bacterium]
MAQLEFLKEVTEPGPEVLQDAEVVRTLAALPPLVPGGGTKVESLADWQAARKQVRRAWLEFLGPMPERPEVQLEVLKEDRPDGLIRQLVRYESEPGLPVEGYLIRPAENLGRGKRAGIVALHQTTNESIDYIAGVGSSPEQSIGLRLAREGFVVFCPRCFLWQDVSSLNEAVEKFRKRHPRTLGMHKMLYDAQRAVDVLASLPEVDADRIGATGHSLGSKETFYLLAFDERVRGGVASEGGLRFTSTNWEAPWYLGRGIQQPDFPLDHHQLLALIAPRPFLVLAGEKGPGAADGRRSWPLLLAAQEIDWLYGEPTTLGLYNHGQGHSIPDLAWQRLVAWLKASTAARA